jgi:hypothetical protein
MWKIADQARGEAMSVLSQPEREQLLDLLARVHENLQTLDARAADARRLHHQALESEARASKGN